MNSNNHPQFNSVPDFSKEEVRSLKRQEEVVDSLDTMSLVDQANNVVNKHRNKLKHLPQSFNNLLHNQLVNYFLNSPERFDTNDKKGLNKKEFTNFRTSMVKKVESMFAQYAPTEDQIKAIKESKEGIKKSKKRKTPKIALSEIPNDPGKIDDLFELEDKLMDYEDYNARLTLEGKSAVRHVNNLNKHYNKYQESLNGLKAYRKFAALFGGQGGRETAILKANIKRGKVLLQKRIERFQKIQDRIKEYGTKLARASNWLREKEIRTKKERLEKLKPEHRKKGEQLYKEAFKDWADLDSQIDGAVLKNNVAHQYALNNMEVQKELFKQMDFKKAGLIESTVGAALSTVAGTINAGGGFLIGTAEKISHKINKAKATTNPLLWGLGKGTSEALNFAIGTAGGVAEMGGGIVGMVAHPIDTAHGMSALVGLNKDISAATAWQNMGKAMIAYDDFKKLNIGVGVGKTFVNIVTSVTGAGALKAGGKAYTAAFKAARAAELTTFQTLKQATTEAIKAGAQSVKESVKTSAQNAVETAKNIKEAPQKIKDTVTEKLKFKETKEKLSAEIDAKLDTEATRAEAIQEIAERAETHHERAALDEVANEQFMGDDIDPNAYYDLINEGYVIPTDAALAKLLDQSIPIPKKFILNGRVKINAPFIDSIIHDIEMLQLVDELLEKGTLKVAKGTNKTRVRGVIKHWIDKARIESESMDIGALIHGNKKWAEKFKTAIKEVTSGEKPSNFVGEALLSLKERDPLGFQIITKADDLKRLGQTEAIQGIFRGNKIEFTNHLGHQVQGYLGSHLGQGGLGTVDNFIYMENGKVYFAAIKRPRDMYGITHRQQIVDKAMKSEAQAAQQLQTWDSKHLIRVLHVDNNGKFIVYETAKDTKDVADILHSNTPLPFIEYLGVMKNIIHGIQDYHAQGMFHGDIKELNVLAMRNNGSEAYSYRIIDNSPNAFSESIQGNWFHTTEYSFTENQLQIAQKRLRKEGKTTQEVSQNIGRSIDAKAVSKMMTNAFEAYFGPDWRNKKALQEVVRPLFNPVSGGRIDTLENLLKDLDNITKDPQYTSFNQLHKPSDVASYSSYGTIPSTLKPTHIPPN